MKILVVKFGALGDVIRTSYLLEPLHEAHPGCRIDWLTADASFDLLRYNPFVTTVATPSFRFQSLVASRYDLLLSFDDEKEILRMTQAIGAGSLVGAYLEGDTPHYCDRSAEWFDMGLISRFGKERADELKKTNSREHNAIFGDMLQVSVASPSFFNSRVTESRVGTRFDSSFYNIGINSGSGVRWESKQLPVPETVKLVRELLAVPVAEKTVRVYLLGGRDEEARHREIRKEVDSDRLFDAGADNSILEFAAIVKNCDYVITSDSLCLHLAVSQGVRNLSFYAPTSAAEIGTFGTGVKVVSLADDYCSYRKDADNSTITADRLVAAFRHHVAAA